MPSNQAENMSTQEMDNNVVDLSSEYQYKPLHAGSCVQ